MAQHFSPVKTTSDHAEGFFERPETIRFGPRSRLGMTAAAGAIALATGVIAVYNGSMKTKRARPSASILAADAPCFEENVAYEFGQGKAGKGQTSWVVGDEKRASAHECQNWCQAILGCEFFTFRKNSQRCLLSTQKGEQRKRGNKGAISGTRHCNVPLRPCQTYTESSSWTVDKAEALGGLTTFKAQVAGQQVTLSTWTQTKDYSSRLAPHIAEGYPAWPKGFPNAPLAYMNYGNADLRKGFNITVDGAPMENMVVMFSHYLPKPVQWNATVSEGLFLRVVDSSPWFRSDGLDNGRTIFLEADLMPVLYSTWRLSKPVSTVSISVSTTATPDHVFSVLMAKGSNCQ